MKSTTYFFLFIILFTISCVKNEKIEIIKSWENGKPEIEIIYSNDSRSDYTKLHYFENGKLEFKGQFINHKEDGTFYWYYSNGNKKWVETFADGESVDTIFCYYESGALKRKNLPPNDLLRQAIEYYETGEIKIKSFLYNSERIDSSWIGFYKNQKIKEVGNIDKGTKVGIWKFYDKKGLLIDSINQSGKDKVVFDFEEEELKYELENSLISDKSN